MSNHYAAGLEGEAIACAYLKQMGIQVLETRFRGKDFLNIIPGIA